MWHRNVFRSFVVAAGLAVLVSGCSETPAPLPSAESPSAESPSAESPSNDVTPSANERPAVSLEIATWDDVQAWVSGQTGKVVVVDVWSTWCAPCLAEFPGFVHLHNTNQGKVACASLSIDYFGKDGTPPAELQFQVREVLQSHNATMTNFLSSDQDEVILGHLKVAAIPATLVYDKTGKLRKTFSNDDGDYGTGEEGYSYDVHVGPFVEKLLSE